jgi:hypothetical protein
VFTSRSFSSSAPFAPLSTGPTTLAAPTLPSHTHSISQGSGSTNFSTATVSPYNLGTTPSSFTTPTGSAPGGAIPASTSGHSHPFSTVSASVNGSVDLSVKYVDIILVVKD